MMDEQAGAITDAMVNAGLEAAAIHTHTSSYRPLVCDIYEAMRRAALEGNDE